MNKRTLVALFAITATLAGCGFEDREPPNAPEVAFAGSPTTPDSAPWSRGAAVATPDATGLEADLHGRYLVPPDRALVRVEVTGHGGSRAAVSDRIRGGAARLVGALAVPGACEVTVVDFGAPRGASERWTDTATLRIDVPLAGAADVGERFARVERCMERFSTLGAEARDLDLAVSHPLPTVDHPDAHRAALLERAFRPMREVEGTTGPAAFDPSGVRCTSRGEVTITERSLHGVAMSVDLECARRPG
ncbi:MAG: hypothetical protein R3B82_29655 [Sandaracinaceae bacterium]